MEPATVYFRWARGLAHPYGELIVVTYDASEKGIAAAISLEPGKILRLEGMHFEGVSTIVTFESTPEAQVHREAAGAPMVIRLLRRLFDLRNKTVLIRNDCAPVIFALRKGSGSPQLQEAAEILSRESLEAGCRTMALHVPGVQLIAEGVDGGSREGAERLRGPACTAWARRLLRDFLQEHGWRVTLDLFAAASNAFVERYVSWTDEPGSEAVDAFDLRSWDQSRCVCGQFHRETLFVFRHEVWNERWSAEQSQTMSEDALWCLPIIKQATGNSCAPQPSRAWRSTSLTKRLSLRRLPCVRILCS